MLMAPNIPIFVINVVLDVSFCIINMWWLTTSQKHLCSARLIKSSLVTRFNTSDYGVMFDVVECFQHCSFV